MRNSHYNAVPAAIIPSCNRFVAADAAELAQAFLTGWSNHALLGIKHGPLINVASDGDRRRVAGSRALVQSTSDLVQLPLLPLLQSGFGTARDFDYKHLVKRHRNPVLGAKGFRVNGNGITSQRLAKIAEALRIEIPADSLNPRDRQNVRSTTDYFALLTKLTSHAAVDGKSEEVVLSPTDASALRQLRPFARALAQFANGFFSKTLSVT